MRVAVAQTLVKRSHRTITLQQALRALDSAADTDPAPDLVVLPAFCDGLEYACGDKHVGERIPGPTISAIGCHARRWGIFVVLGLAERRDDGVGLTAAMVDPDADVVMIRREPRPAAHPAGTRGKPAISPATYRNVLNARIGLFTPRDWRDAPAWRACREAGVSLIVGPACGLDPRRRPAKPEELANSLCGLARGESINAALADFTTGDPKGDGACPGVSLAVNSAGQIVCQSAPFRSETLVATFRLPDVSGTPGETPAD